MMAFVAMIEQWRCIVNRYYYKEADTKKIADYYNKMRDQTRKSNDN